MRPLARGLHELAHSPWSQPGGNGLTRGTVQRRYGRLDGVDRFSRFTWSDLVRCRGRRSLPDGDGTNNRVIVATIDVEASRIGMLGHVTLPFLAGRSRRFDASR